jgi:hypothetical protein
MVSLRSVSHDWIVGVGTNEESFFTEIAAPTTSLTTELTLFNKSKRQNANLK